jgi:hypothetical protein
MHYFREGATHIDVWECAGSRVEAEAIERALIRTLDPMHNTQHSPRVEANDLAWRAYCDWLAAYERSTWDKACFWARDPDVAAEAASAARECGVDNPWTPELLDVKRQRDEAALWRAVNALPRIIPQAS